MSKTKNTKNKNKSRHNKKNVSRKHKAAKRSILRKNLNKNKSRKNNNLDKILIGGDNEVPDPVVVPEVVPGPRRRVFVKITNSERAKVKAEKKE